MPTELGRRLPEAYQIIIEGMHRDGWESLCSICEKSDGKPKYWVRIFHDFEVHPTQKYAGAGDVGGYICPDCIAQIESDKRVIRDFRKEP